jgi:hypothetical protein
MLKKCHGASSAAVETETQTQLETCPAHWFTTASARRGRKERSDQVYVSLCVPFPMQVPLPQIRIGGQPQEDI